jgi:RNA polymerase sigma-70 factor (ECF subfamily)
MSHHAPDRSTWDWTTARRRCLREAYRMTRSRPDAEDAVQEAMLRAWRMAPSCREPEAPLPWMLQITRRETLRVLGRTSRTREATVADVPETSGEDDGEARVHARVDLERALRGLSHDDRMLLALRYGADLTQPKVAEILGLAEGTAKVRLHRLRHRLSTSLSVE